jgi:hypothetical protein
VRSPSRSRPMPDPTESRKALAELIDLLREIDERYLSP